ncbi:protein-cysteine n-palmitoyltransferase rasp [Anaeramoeba ignava]|uniref:Protein-cysteine n-palmitoyltransferase rasp n=1 Tax=Anaeramoeba ignava TaxID=1746090 RepID=A0A9Q0LGP5_ANAIG|nr:protein-cysteine n-palmitoyltransferase rasp [Anaeramoeba ignava]
MGFIEFILEYKFYILTILTHGIWQLFGIRFSQETKGMNRAIRKGWFFGRGKDFSDPQWNVWMKNFFLLFSAMILFLFLSFLVRKLSKNNTRIRLIFYNSFSFIFLFYIHSSTALFVYSIALINFLIIKQFRKQKKTLAILVWIFNSSILFSADYYSGYSWKRMHSSLAWLDNYRGMLRWDIYWNISMLRYISFAFDYHWAETKRKVIDLTDRSSYFKRQERHLPIECYTFEGFIAYIFYVPLYIAGPITTYNAFYSHIQKPQKQFSLKQIFYLLGQVLLYTLGLEIMLHFNYSYSINDSGLWRKMPSYRLPMIGHNVLNFMFVKFVVFWRFFRTIALFDGVETPENMTRCASNNATFAGFWRSWHASFNKWTIRYLYIPLGGKKTEIYSIWIIFTFIGLWHDLFIRWLAWAWFNCFFFSFEIVIMKFFRSPKTEKFRNSKFYYPLYISALILDCFCLIISNLAILHGFQGSYDFIKKMFFTESSWRSWLGVVFTLYVSVEVMKDIRKPKSITDPGERSTTYKIGRKQEKVEKEKVEKDKPKKELKQL